MNEVNLTLLKDFSACFKATHDQQKKESRDLITKLREQNSSDRKTHTASALTAARFTSSYFPSLSYRHQGNQF